jgi:hypothetical protein
MVYFYSSGDYSMGEKNRRTSGSRFSDELTEVITPPSKWGSRFSDELTEVITPPSKWGSRFSDELTEVITPPFEMEQSL